MADIRQALELAKSNPDSPFASELRKRIESGKLNVELQSSGIQPVAPSEDSGFFSNVSESFKKRVEKGSDAIVSNQSLGNKILQTVGQGAGFVGDVVSELPIIKQITGLAGKGISALSETAPIKAVGEAISPVTQKAVETWESLPEDTRKNLEAVVNIGSLIPIGKGAVGGVKGAIKAGEKVVDIATPIVKGTGNIIGSTYKTAKTLGTGIKELAISTAKGTKNIPERIATNVAEKQVTRNAIKSLPTQTARKAVENGVDIKDIKSIYSIPKSQKPVARKLLQNIEDFESGKTKIRPEETIGKPMIARIKELESTRGKVGNKLGKVADSLGEVSNKESFPVVFKELKKVSGLNGLTVNKKGVLDFSNTGLTTAETLADRKAIQNIFNSAVKGGTGKQKHLLRQELFEVLGGKKKSLTNLTATQEKAYEAIRKGLSNVLDTKNTSYKALNKQYATLSRPLQDIRKFLKDTGGLDDDILNMKAGILARRLTSNAPSGVDIKAALRAMDKATKVAGKSQLKIEGLQDLYNTLNKYYDIAGGTTIEKAVQTGVEKATGGITETLLNVASEFAGKTKAVQRKAIEEALKEALR